MAAAGHGDPMGMQGWVVILFAAPIGFFLMQGLDAPEPPEDRFESYYDDPTRAQANPRVAVAPDAPQENPSEPAAIPASLPTSIGSPPMVSLTELSGPELEALLDLWQREPGQAERTGVSF
jgi:hypothetical protein